MSCKTSRCDLQYDAFLASAEAYGNFLQSMGSMRLTDRLSNCLACDGRGYFRCDCWPGDCVCDEGAPQSHDRGKGKSFAKRCNACETGTFVAACCLLLEYLLWSSRTVEKLGCSLIAKHVRCNPYRSPPEKTVGLRSLCRCAPKGQRAVFRVSGERSGGFLKQCVF